MRTIKVFLSALLFFSFIGCDSDDNESPIRIDPELKPYIERFIAEGEKRGRFFKIENIQARFVDEFTLTDSQGFCGYAVWDTNGGDKGEFEIKFSENCWINRTEIERENLVFHELGHAMLKRRHKSELFPNRYPNSIMCSAQDNIDCSNFDIYYELGSFREYYLDELFNSKISDPNFTTSTNYDQTVYIENDTEEYFSEWELYTYIDNELVENDSMYFSFSKESSNSITLSQNSSLTNAEGLLLRRFEISQFQECSNIKAFSNILATNISRGRFEKGLSIREKLDDGTLNRLHFFAIEEFESGFYEEYKHELYCIPKNASVITISYTLSSQVPSSLKIDDLRVDLYKND